MKQGEAFGQGLHLVCDSQGVGCLQAEADVAAGLFLQLTAFCEAARQRGQQVPEYEVGVVTPYRQQKACLRETFERMAGPAASSKVQCLRPYLPLPM